MKKKVNMKNRSDRYNINGPSLDIGTNIVNITIVCISMMMLIRIKQHLSNIWSSIHEKVKQHWGWVEKSVAYKKACICICCCHSYVFLNQFLSILSRYSE